MSTVTSSVPVLRLSRREEMRRLRRAHRLQVRRRRLDEIQYRYRHVMTVCTSGFFAVTCLVVCKTIGLI